MKCVYRSNKECRMPRRTDDSRMNCQLCLIGQLCDETSLNTMAIMEKSIDKTEKLIAEDNHGYNSDPNQIGGC